MSAFFLRRALWFLITIWIVLTVSFFLMRAVPGGPFSADRAVDPIVEANLRQRYHFDWPLTKQYLQYTGPFNLDEHGLFGDRTRVFGGLLTGDLGPSFQYLDFSVNDIIRQSLPISIQLGVFALLWAISIGLVCGIASALRPHGALDVGVRLLATAGIALPNFVIAGFLIGVFALTLPWFPVAGWGSARHMVLPSLALGLPFAAYISRLLRTAMLEILSQSYIRTAIAKGMPARIVIGRHALKGALLPVISYLGPASAGILTGSLVIERIFFIPGTGSHFVQSALNRDYTLAMGVTLLYTGMVYGLNTLVDLAYTLIDPRIRTEEA